MDNDLSCYTTVKVSIKVQLLAPKTKKNKSIYPLWNVYIVIRYPAMLILFRSMFCTKLRLKKTTS